MERLLSTPCVSHAPGSTSHHHSTFSHVGSSSAKKRQGRGSSLLLLGLEEWRREHLSTSVRPAGLYPVTPTYGFDAALILSLLLSDTGGLEQELSLQDRTTRVPVAASSCPPLRTLNVTHPKVSNSQGRYQTSQGSSGFYFSFLKFMLSSRLYSLLRVDFRGGSTVPDQPVTSTRACDLVLYGFRLQLKSGSSTHFGLFLSQVKLVE